jgi:hypothetical protein
MVSLRIEENTYVCVFGLWAVSVGLSTQLFAVCNTEVGTFREKGEGQLELA